ncbi:MAG: ATP-grasp domain-containing protein [Propionibacteriaceae bacterium]|nr:ATP-grasp domain-containing protein [Propionibacteriaceae bacterium]
MPQLTKVLIANRGEIAVRVARACTDAGIASVAVYADDDRDALHVRVADEAYSLGGVSAAETYLDIHKLISVAHRAGADAVHPGYGFLSESAGFAQAVVDAGLIWIGPPPGAIRALGDKVSARHVAAKVGAPLAAGTSEPVGDAGEIEAFADAHGLPIVIKAAFGGGGRGLKVVENREDIPELFDLAVREATADFGRGECFVEQYLDRPRHIETQCLADSHGNVVVVSTRDCSLQRRHQKLVEEAPAPFISAEQQDELVRASKAILREAGYVGAGTCEFLLTRDGVISFLEVNTRLQVEHPVSEEVCGIDLVREQFRIAAGEELGYALVETRGHAFEFRLYAEDPSTFVPTPGKLTTLRLPGGPGVRLDFGYAAGDTMSAMFDSMIGKVVVWGADRTQALARARRALAEISVVGVPTGLLFHQAVVNAPDFTAGDGHFGVHTRWIDTDFGETLKSLSGEDEGVAAADASTAQPGRVVVEVGGKRLEIVIPSNLGALFPPRNPAPAPRPQHSVASSAPKRGAGTVTAPMQGVVVKVAAESGQTVEEGDLLVVIEAMKMEQSVYAPVAGTVSALTVTPGDRVTSGQAICTVR